MTLATHIMVAGAITKPFLSQSRLLTGAVHLLDLLVTLSKSSQKVLPACGRQAELRQLVPHRPQSQSERVP